MPYTTLISTAALAAEIERGSAALIDCRFDLARPGWGEAQYRAAHLPGAVYAHLDRHLSGPATGRNGRHPLPDPDRFMRQLGEWGIDANTQVVAYDQDTGMYASRLWWLLRWVGHRPVAVLDGGWARWLAEGRPAVPGDERRPPAVYHGAVQPGLTLTAAEVERLRADPAYRLLDARAPQRYRGETEPIDPVAGRIPGAANHPVLANTNPDGTWLSPAALRARLLSVLGSIPPERTIHYCGSGVAAAQNILALEHAGFPGARLYPGSWSEWCADPSRPVATGDPDLASQSPKS
jgi:thiosulfate/3-mercaptopyruvate sulfurtransferase